MPFMDFRPNTPSYHHETEKVNMASLLMDSFLHIQRWAMTTKDKTPQVSIGGIITPILRACNVRLGEPTAHPSSIDLAYLFKMKYLLGTKRQSFGYSFNSGRGRKVILLPNQELTTLMVMSNVAFNHGQEHWYNEAEEGPLKSLRKRNNRRQSEEAGPSTEHPSPQLSPQDRHSYGSKRYDFTPFEDYSYNVSTNASHQHIKVLKRWCKWQDRTMQKLVNTVKVMKRQIKGLKAKSSCSCSNANEDVMRSGTQPEPMEQNPEEDVHQPRSSSYEAKHQKRKLMESYDTDSSNPSYSLEDEDTSGSHEF